MANYSVGGFHPKQCICGFHPKQETPDHSLILPQQ